jgi:predicted AAA+ superfamily ATPase
MPGPDTVLDRIAGLILYRGVLADEAGRLYVDLVRGAVFNPLDRLALTDLFSRLVRQLLTGRRFLSRVDPWAFHLANRVLYDENPFSLQAEQASWAELAPALRRQAEAELSALGELARFGLGELARLLGVGLALIEGSETGAPPPGTADLRLRLVTARDWAALAPELAGHYLRNGVGLFGRYRAFRWQRREGAGRLVPVEYPDPVRLSDLVGYDEQKAAVVANTERLLAGLPALNVLLYGDRGTGKSSLVKALVNEFGDRGLRLVELGRSDLRDYPEILAAVRDRPQKFILMIDDLSFEEAETEYKSLKSLLEGTLEARPRNLVVYATSNRRHLVREFFGDRPAPGDEVHPADTQQEKLSLVDRFGLRIRFLAPDRDGYLKIVRSLAAGRPLAMDGRNLDAEALRWALSNGGWSGRTARQFVDSVTVQNP